LDTARVKDQRSKLWIADLPHRTVQKAAMTSRWSKILVPEEMYKSEPNISHPLIWGGKRGIPARHPAPGSSELRQAGCLRASLHFGSPFSTGFSFRIFPFSSICSSVS
jgi:hypothetical protein